MFAEKPATIRRALGIVAEAGGTIKSLMFAHRMWPEEKHWKPRPKRNHPKARAVSVDSRMTRRAGSILGRIAHHTRTILQVHPQTWQLTPEGWRYLSTAFAQPTPGAPAASSAPPTGGGAMVARVHGYPHHTPYAVSQDPRYPQHFVVQWHPQLAPMLVPRTLVSWQPAPPAAFRPAPAAYAPPR